MFDKRWEDEKVMTGKERLMSKARIKTRSGDRFMLMAKRKADEAEKLLDKKKEYELAAKKAYEAATKLREDAEKME